MGQADVGGACLRGCFVSLWRRGAGEKPIRAMPHYRKDTEEFEEKKKELLRRM